MSDNLLIVHGPNLNLLGRREPEIYGHTSFTELCNQIKKRAELAAIEIENFQSNSESKLIDRLHQCIPDPSITSSNLCLQRPDLIIINPGGFSHTSVALLDAVLATQLPFIEVHLSNIHSREAFRHFSYFSQKAKAVICGMGIHGYFYALDYAIQQIKASSKKK